MMTHTDKISWMYDWCKKNGLSLQLEGTCGFGRECVGVVVYDTYPDYMSFDDKTYERIDDNGDVWVPDDAYHKHPCVAVLGRGERAEAHLYEWLRWFDEHKFRVSVKRGELCKFLGQRWDVRMVRYR